MKVFYSIFNNITNIYTYYHIFIQYLIILPTFIHITTFFSSNVSCALWKKYKGFSISGSYNLLMVVAILVPSETKCGTPVLR